ncbi:ACP S-malonyltransferase [Motiliproteus sediminis]|uniref:ACP S-malonyltransferase n=1 Tax=Motiliproteus sediminis TaxID=1468178 RepID=UPI001AEFCBCA|nr:ACP S-malonyltransferase [Motiliproteus sediminis]
MSNRQQALVICPGRGTYNAPELGYLKRFHSDKRALLDRIDAYRQQQGQPLLSALDGMERYNLKEHSRGDNASALIWACAYADFLSIDRECFDICAVTGNSMGWYIALGCAGALAPDNALQLINTMGTLMHRNGSGGQLIYPLVDRDWQPIPGRAEWLDRLTAAINAEPGCELALSINLGGLRVFGGNRAALKRLMEQLPPEQERYPMQLYNHAAFHTALQQPVAAEGRRALPAALLEQPQLPLVDGRGAIWNPESSNTAALWEYTLGHQVVAPYDFSRAVQVAVKEFAPDKIIILGPGTTLGGAVAQALIQIGWRGWQSKSDFIKAQKADPYLISLGMEHQRRLAVA